MMIILLIAIAALAVYMFVVILPTTSLGKGATGDLEGNGVVPSFLEACTDWTYVGCTYESDGTFYPRYDKSKERINMFEVCRLKTSSEYVSYDDVVASGMENDYWNNCKSNCLGCKQAKSTPTETVE